VRNLICARSAWKCAVVCWEKYWCLGVNDMSVLGDEYLTFWVGCCRRWFSMRVSREDWVLHFSSSTRWEWYQELRLIYAQHATFSCVRDIEQGIHPGYALNWDFFLSMESTLHYKFLVRNGIRSRKMYIEHSIYLKMDFFKKMSGSYLFTSSAIGMRNDCKRSGNNWWTSVKSCAMQSSSMVLWDEDSG
jgi:hypothetical protein